MVLGLLLREQEERRLAFDFEMMLPDDNDMDGGDGGDGSGRKDFKRGTVVCRHWLRGLCMKGDNCEFLHQYDMSKMPECRWGMECQVPECPFRHVPDEERVECAFYRQGFCSHGPNCRYRHIKLAREECPEQADFSLQSKVADEENVKRRKSQPVNEFFKIAICKHWAKMGSCPFNDECHFAHGEKELRPFPKGGERDPRAGGGPGGANGGRDHHDGPSSQATGNGSGPNTMGPSSAPPPLVMPDEGKFCKYFLVHSLSYHNVAHGVHFNQWTLPRELQQTLKFASETCDDVFLFLTISPSKHFQAVARLTPGALLHAGADDGEDLSAAIVPYLNPSEGRSTWRGAFGVEWLRICECPWERLAQFENQTLAIDQTYV
jgi:cleavage and polyadenylation specificity factor subunit 4